MNCVFCGSSNNLNTAFQISLDDGQKVQVHICDEHAEDATVKSAKTAYLNKQKQIEQFLEQAKALGLNVTFNTGNKIDIATANNPVQQQVAERQPITERQAFRPNEMPDFDGDPNMLIDTDRLDNGRMFTSASGSTEFGMVEGHSGLNADSFTDKLSPDVLRGKAKMAMVEGREGIPIAIPEQRIDGTGTTRITIKNNMNDVKLQNTFKKMAESSIKDHGPDFAKSGYKNSTYTCTFCRGECTIRNGNKTMMCPKCSGSGIISAY